MLQPTVSYFLTTPFGEGMSGSKTGSNIVQSVVSVSAVLELQVDGQKPFVWTSNEIRNNCFVAAVGDEVGMVGDAVGIIVGLFVPSGSSLYPHTSVTSAQQLSESKQVFEQEHCCAK